MSIRTFLLGHKVGHFRVTNPSRVVEETLTLIERASSGSDSSPGRSGSVVIIAPMLAPLILLNVIFAVASGGNVQASVIESKDKGIPPDAQITLRQDGLLITITADGSVAVEGQTFDFDIGRIKMKISHAEVKSLVGEFEQIGYFSQKDHYFEGEDGCPDSGTVCRNLTTIATSLTLNVAFKSVTRYPYGCVEKDGSSIHTRLWRLSNGSKRLLI